MKALIYCNKAKPYLLDQSDLYDFFIDEKNTPRFVLAHKDYTLEDLEDAPVNILNGKVVASFELDKWEKMFYGDLYNTQYYFAEKAFLNVITITENLLNKACLTQNEIVAYGKGKDLYAYHIDNLKVFDEPVELGDLYSYNKLLKAKNYKDKDLNDTIERIRKLGNLDYYRVKKAPQSYMYVWYKGEVYLLMSDDSIWVEKMINKQKTVEIRKVKPKGVE